jgi:RNA polymerase sigma-70 factor (ECF subfamily)
MRAKALNNFSDEEVINKILVDGQHQYFSILYKKYYSKVLDKCYSLLKDRNLAEEFTEDIFSKVFEKLNGFKNNSAFSSWLYSITYNHCIDYLREKKKLHYPEWNSQNEMPEIIDDNNDDTPIINYDDLLKIMEMIHPEEKALLMAKYYDDLSIKQISESLRVSEDAAKMRIKRAKARVYYLYKLHFFQEHDN